KGIEPEKPFKGSFNIRPGTELHRRAAYAAIEQGINLNQLVTEALEQYLR
ncbi:MAG: type II toxin-antitoxin system HicB family antitoxin, partial [Moorea sp. SIO2I5]|nr:type II toxin-antitoxin system HicB family antitoxin [Moorena sp. SIO2I5]